MKRKKGEKRTLLEEGWLIVRGIRVWNEIMPGYLFSQMLYILAETFSPYFGIYMSARLVDELSAGADKRQLLLLAAVTVSGGFLLAVLTRLLRGWSGIKGEYMIERPEEYIFRRQNAHQYEHLENPDIVQLRSRIWTDAISFGGGLYRIRWAVPNLLQGLFNLMFSVSLTVSMIVRTAEGDYTGIFQFINSPWSATVLVALLAGAVYFSVRISVKGTQKMQEAVSGLSEDNTRLKVYRGLWSADMTVLGLHSLVLAEMYKYNVHPAWVVRQEKVQIKYNIFSTVLNVVVNIFVFLFVAAKAFIGAFGIGSFILYQGTLGRFIDAVSGLAGEFGRLKHNNQYLVRLFRYLDLPNEMYQGTLAVEKRDDIDYEIEFRDVSFRYPRTENWVLRHVNAKFKIGERMTLVGENGSGKTTFVKLLCRLYDPTEGTILLNGIDIAKYRYEEYLALFSVVFQDYRLFGFPLGEEVASGVVYDSEKVRDCLVRAGMGEKLADLDADPEAAEPDTLKRAISRDYDVEAIEFSGGEEQKIAIARAIYKDAPFVVLDEPTAALDPLAEAEVYENFSRMVRNKTSVFVSHRLSSCRFCDKILVFDHGGIVQEGAHDNLVAQTDGKYYELWRAQAQYYEK